MLWADSHWAREKLAKNDVRRIYYGLLILFTIWSIYLMYQGQPLFLVAFMANAANLAFFVAGLHLLFMRKLYPKEIRPGALNTAVILILVLFYGTFAIIGIGTRFFGLQI